MAANYRAALRGELLCGFRGCSVEGFRDLVLCFRASGIQGFKVLELQGFRVLGLQGFRALGF